MTLPLELHGLKYSSMHLLNHFVAELWACSLALVALSVIKVPTIIDRVTSSRTLHVIFSPKQHWVGAGHYPSSARPMNGALSGFHVPLVRNDSCHSHISPMSTNQQVCVHFRSRSEPHELFQSSIWCLRERVLHPVIKDLYLAPERFQFSAIRGRSSTMCLRL